MRVLVACEFSGVVREAFARRGHDAWSCDLLPTEIPGQHIQGDVCDVLEDGWDLMIAHPPCTYLCSSGLHWNKRVQGRDELTHQAMVFVFNLMGEGFISHGIKRICLENPIGRISTAYRKPDQIKSFSRGCLGTQKASQPAFGSRDYRNLCRQIFVKNRANIGVIRLLAAKINLGQALIGGSCEA